MELIYHADAKTRKIPGLKGPNLRPDAKAPNANPIRRFREEMRMTRDDFAEILHTNKETVRSWERDPGPVVPSGPRLNRLLALAQANKYPLYYHEIRKHCGAD